MAYKELKHGARFDSGKYRSYGKLAEIQRKLAIRVFFNLYFKIHEKYERGMLSGHTARESLSEAYRLYVAVWENYSRAKHHKSHGLKRQAFHEIRLLTGEMAKIRLHCLPASLRKAEDVAAGKEMNPQEEKRANLILQVAGMIAANAEKAAERPRQQFELLETTVVLGDGREVSYAEAGRLLEKEHDWRIKKVPIFPISREIRSLWEEYGAAAKTLEMKKAAPGEQKNAFARMQELFEKILTIAAKAGGSAG